MLGSGHGVLVPGRAGGGVTRAPGWAPVPPAGAGGWRQGLIVGLPAVRRTAHDARSGGGTLRRGRPDIDFDKLSKVVNPVSCEDESAVRDTGATCGTRRRNPGADRS
ncbi:hypothetical protein GCM10009818_25780 [Nakamurella flavida]